MNKKHGRISEIDRFNRNPKNDKFIENFQEVMIQRLNLNHIKKYHKENINRIVRSVTGNHPNRMRTKISGGFLLSCIIEPELYIQIQDTIKNITGEFISIDELIHLLLTYFCRTYQNILPENQLPFKHIYKGKRFSKLLLFQKRFKRFYPNIVKNFME